MIARSVIALPLLEQILEEEEVTKAFPKKHRELDPKYNAVLILKLRYTGGEPKQQEQVEQLLTKATAPERGGQPPPEAEWIFKRKQRLCLTRLDGRQRRRLLALNRDHPAPPIRTIWPSLFDVIIDVNLEFKPDEQILPDLLSLAGLPTLDELRRMGAAPDTRVLAKALIARYIEQAKAAEGVSDDDQRVDQLKTNLIPQYVLARLQGSVIQRLVEIDRAEAGKLALLAEEAEAQAEGRAANPENARLRRYRTLFHIWPDFSINTCLTHSVATVKADAALRSFSAAGQGVVWAVMDTGIDADHPHFKLHGNIDKSSALHQDFTGESNAGPATALTDPRGHGTHVAGIIGGEQIRTADTLPKHMDAVYHELDERDVPVYRERPLDSIAGIAPRCKLVSLRVLDEFGDGKAGNLLAAIAHIQLANDYGRKLRIHGVNISLGYPFEAKWFACGHSPLCVEINRLVKSGVVVVVAAGNTGYGTLRTAEGESDTSLALTINDPGNAALAITVGSTHRDQPHKFGVSYFSSKGPTGDGRLKPDLIAPGEKIVSCAVPGSDLSKREGAHGDARYLETSGTSMAAPHVSGAVAAFLSIRREFIGEPERLKQIFLSTATDLGRDRYFQGHGLLDLMRAIQSV